MSLNKVLLIGEVADDPVVRESGRVSLTIYQEDGRFRSWHRVSATGKGAEVAKNLRKGDGPIYVEGALSHFKPPDGPKKTFVTAWVIENLNGGVPPVAASEDEPPF